MRPSNKNSLNKPKRTRTKKRNTDARANDQLVIIREPLLPNSVVVPLQLEWSFALNSSSNQNYRFYANNYKPVVATSTPTFNGYSFWALGYDYYRITKTRVQFTAVNSEAFAVVVYQGYFNDDPTTNPGTALMSNPLTSRKVISPTTGMDRVTFDVIASMQEIVGDRGIVSKDPNYRAATGTSPADLLWYSIGARSENGSNFTNGVTIDAKITAWTMFFARKQQ